MSDRLPKSLYIHIPYCVSKCIYCGFYSVPIGKNQPDELLDAEIAELKNAELSKPVETIYIGGGSPSCLGEKVLCGFLEDVIAITGRSKEFTVEVNPGQVDKSLLIKLRSLGVNRLSIGAQSFCDSQLKMLGRIHNSKDITKTIEYARVAGFGNISIDLIFALPGSDMGSWQRTLKKAIACNVEHISAYSLSYENGTPLSAMKATEEILPIDESIDRDMYEMTIAMLTNAGFEHYEISNFTKPDFQCKHNLVYWDDGDYLGIGPAAGSHINDERKMNIENIEKYINTINTLGDAAIESQVLTSEDATREKMVLGLRKIKGVNLEEFKNDCNFDAMKLFSETISKYQAMKMMKIENGFLSLTKNALPIADSILCEFVG